MGFGPGFDSQRLHYLYFIIMRITKLKMQDKLSIRLAIQHIMSYKLNQWWTPLQMQAAMWRIGAKISSDETLLIMDDLYTESIDSPLSKYERDHCCLSWRCVASFTPKYTA